MKAIRDTKSPGISKRIKFLAFILLFAIWGMVGVFIQVGKQAEVDKRQLAGVAEQQVLSQRIAKYTLAASAGDSKAFAQLMKSKQRFANILEKQKNGFTGLEPGSKATQHGAFSRLESRWHGFRSSVDKVLDGQVLILSVAEAAGVMAEVMPQLMEHTGDVVEMLVKNRSSRQHISLASRQAMLSQRIVNNINRLMTGEGAETAVVGFAEDTSEFGNILEGMLRGSSEIQAVSGEKVKAKLRDIAMLFSRVSDHVGAVVDNSEELVSLQAAARAISSQSEDLFSAATSLQETFSANSQQRVVSSELAYLLGAVALFILFWIALETLLGQRRRHKAVESENARHQQSIMQLLDEMGDLAAGDLTVRTTVTEDFTGAIADSINVTVDSLRGLVKTINDTSTQLSSSVQETEEIAKQLTSLSEKQSQDIALTSSSINEMASSMDEVSTNASESSKVAMRSVEIAKKGGEAVQRTMEGMDNIREHIQETSKRIKRLGESSQEIGDIVELINDIAEQTNILALNASIQASMAGEAGRGFAVVADEVQRLAERSANATKQIEALVKTIQADTNEAVISMEKSTAGVVNGARLAEDAGGALEEIENVSEQLAALIQTISGSARQQAGAAADISTTMSGIQQVTTQTASGTQGTSRSIGNLTKLAHDLDKSVAGFKLP